MKVICDISVSSARHRPNGSSVPWYTPWNSPLTNTAPGLVLDFSDDSYGTGGALGSLASTISFSRASEGTRTNPSGQLEVVAANIARIDHDPNSFAPIGMLLEVGRTNLFVQSDTPADQSVSVTAAEHVLSFYGTGTVTLGGAHTAIVVGNGAYPVRSEIGFMPSAGNLSITLSGSITSPQLEEGSVASSYIPTVASAVAREDDIATIPLASWFNVNEGTLVFEGSLDSAQANDRIIEMDAGATTTRLSVLWNTVLGKPQFQVWEAGALQAAIAPAGNTINLGDPFRVAIAYKANDFGVSLNGGAVSLDSSGVLATGLTTMRFGRSVWGAQGQMLAESIIYYPQRLSDSEIQALSA